MKTNKLLILTVMAIISVGCSNKGNGDVFYVEYYEDISPTVHSTLDCEAIRGGVESFLPGQVSYELMCAKCMDDDLYKIATEGKKTDDDDNDDDF